MKMTRIIQFITCAALVAFLSGCDEDEERYQLRFSHYLHVTENEMGCDECHGEPGQPDFNTITHDTCLDCHDEPEAEEISADTCGICHQEKQVSLFEASASPAEAAAGEGEEAETAAAPAEAEEAAAPAQSVFVHTEALAEKCADCHDYLLDEELETVPVLGRDDIVDIRNQAHMSGQECSTCHVDMDPMIAPASHDMAWHRRHGQFAMQPDASCSVCHTQDNCMDCHSVMQPASHNNIFRTRTHGIIAATDRNSCMVCHLEDSCTSCHTSTRPRSHNARWAAAGRNPSHCIACHTEASPGEGCVVCHENGNNLELHESFWPSSHNENPVGEIGCYQCHWVNTP